MENQPDTNDRKKPSNGAGVPPRAWDVLQGLPGLRHSDDRSFVARCPAHDDHTPSLSVSLSEEGAVLLCCHASCPTEAVLGAVDLQMRDLFPATPHSQRSAEDETDSRHLEHPYRDLSGGIVVVVHRVEDRATGKKTRRPWRTPRGVRSTDVPIYRHPEVKEGSDPAVVVEGEHKADLLWELGICATCNLGGAGKWQEHHTEQLRGRHVIAWPDNDDPGRKHADAVCAALREAAASVRIVEPPAYLEKGGDVVDVLRSHDEAEVRRLIGAAAAWQPQETPTERVDDRPTIYAGAADLAATVDAAWEALEAHNDPVRLLRFGSTVVAVEEDEDIDVVVAEQSGDALRVLLARAARWITVKKQRNGERHESDAYPPLAVAKGMLAGNPSRLPSLGRVIRAPIMARSGRIVEREGYDRETRCWLASGVALPPIPMRPNEDQVRDAIQLIAEEWLGDFPFVDAADTANALALVLLPFARELIDGPTPLHLVEKPTPGSGASLLLGGSANVYLPVRCVWAATGNNPMVSSEMARRSVSIRLDAKVERPWERTQFRHPHLPVWTAEHRAVLLGAALTLLRAWHVGGRPKGKTSIGSFEEWAAVMGGILEIAGVEGFLANRERFYDRADREAAAWSTFIGAWLEKWGDADVGAKDLWELLEHVDPPSDLGRGNERSQRTRLGAVLASAVDRRYTIDGRQLRIASAGSRNRAAQYRLVLE